MSAVSEWPIFLWRFTVGYGGTIPLTIVLRSQLFEQRIFATMGGIASAMTAIAMVASPVLSGYI